MMVNEWMIDWLIEWVYMYKYINWSLLIGD